MSKLAFNLDHFGIFGTDVNQLADQWRAMGFHVVGPAELEAIDDAGNSHPIGQQSAHVMFAEHYIELTSVARPQPGHHLERFFGTPKGLRLILLKSTDIVAEQKRCADAGLSPGEVRDAARKLTYGAQGTAGFRWFDLPAAQFPDALVCYVQHLTPEMVFDPAQCQHINTATHFTRIGWCGDAVPPNYQKLSEKVPLSTETRVESLPLTELRTLLTPTHQELPHWAVLGVSVEDPDRLTQQLDNCKVPYERRGSRVIVQPAETGGVLLVFETFSGSC